MHFIKIFVIGKVRTENLYLWDMSISIKFLDV